jgi:hypothetical protein
MLQGEKNREKAKLTQHHEKNAEALQWDCKTMKIKYINSIFINRTCISRYIVFSYDGLSFKGPKDDHGVDTWMLVPEKFNVKARKRICKVECKQVSIFLIVFS